VVDPAPAGAGGSSIAIGVGAALAVIVLGIGAVLLLGRGRTPTRANANANGESEPPVRAEQASQPSRGPTASARPNVNPSTPTPSTAAFATHPSVPATPVAKTGPLRVAVLKFQNVGKDPALAMLEQGIGETAVHVMAASGSGVQLIERGDIDSDIGEIDRGKDVHFDKLSVAKLGQLEGVEVAVQGGFQRAGRTLRITARFIRVVTGEVIDTLMVTRPARDLFGAQDEVARGLHTKLVALAALERAK
jgi:TolB-like protein